MVQAQSKTTQEPTKSEMRQLLRAGAVDLHEVPSWLTQRIRAYRKAKGLEPVPSGLFQHSLLGIADGDFTWLDHWGESKKGPYTCCQTAPNFVSEPYSFSSKDARSLDAFCNALGGLEWHVSSDTWWNPGRTVRITIHESVKKIAP